MKCQRYSLHSSVRGRLPSMQIGSAYLTSMGTSWNMPLLMEKKKKKKGRGECNSALFIAVATRLIRKSPCHSPPASSSVPAIQINILLLQGSSLPRASLPFCHTSEWAMTTGGYGWSQTKWGFLITQSPAPWKRCMSTWPLRSPWQPANLHQVTIWYESVGLNIASLKIIPCHFQNSPP